MADHQPSIRTGDRDRAALLLKIITLAFAAGLLAIALLANQPQRPGFMAWVRHVPLGDKISHFLLVGVLAFMVNLAFRAARIRIAGRRFLLGNLLLIVLVTSEEFSQIFLEYRAFELGDLLADYLGIWIFGRWAAAVTGRRESPAKASRA